VNLKKGIEMRGIRLRHRANWPEVSATRFKDFWRRLRHRANWPEVSATRFKDFWRD
jgi:hypothetical protein